MGRRRTRNDSRPIAGGTRYPRADGIGAGWVNQISGQGGLLDRQVWTGYAGGCPLDRWQIQELILNNAIARRIVRREGEDALRQGWTVTGLIQGQPITEDQQTAISTWNDQFQIPRLLRNAHAQAKATGGALWAFGLEDGQDPSQPLDLLNLREINWVRVVPKGWASVASWNDNPRSRRWQRPETYLVTFARGSSMVMHWSRVVVFEGLEVAEVVQDERFFGFGASMLDLIWTDLRAYGVSHQQAIEALTKLSQGVWHNEDLARAVDAGDADAVKAHYERASGAGGLLTDFITSGGESYQVVGRPVGGLGDLIDRFVSALVAATDMPRTILLGEQPSGLNANADSEIRAWYDFLASIQPETFGTPLTRLYQLASRVPLGPTMGVPITDVGIDWPSLWQLTDQEKADTRLKNSQARAADLTAHVVQLGEARSDPDVAEHYELAPLEEVAEAAPEGDVVVEDIEIADQGAMPVGEDPVGLKVAASALGFRSGRAALNFAVKHDVPVFKFGAQFRLFPSQLQAAMRESQVQLGP